DGVKLTFNLDPDYEIVRTQLTHNVVAMVEGSDPQLKKTYVAFGAHYDHLGYSEGEVVSSANGPRRIAPPPSGFVKPGAEDDRISSELDAVTRAANASLAKPMTLDYEFNDPSDPEQLYFRSDHYSYAAKGIPVIFFTTGLHPDYHMNTDEVSKIEFDKMARVG